MASLKIHPFRAALSLLFIAITGAVGQAADETVTLPLQAAGIGAWATDWPAAVKVAQERKLPLFIQFTGSDWCGWCIKMEKECFSKPEFPEAMKTRCVLVVVDFPHKTKLSDELKAAMNEVVAGS